MADQERNRKTRQYVNEPEQDAIKTRSGQQDYQEETAAEIAAPVSNIKTPNNANNANNGGNAGNGQNGQAGGMTGSVLGYSALALSIMSLFVLPLLFGTAGIVLGFMARRRGASALGSWAIGIGAVSIIVGIFILPFLY
ncbi:hypothetical protein [Bacillus sp. T33-2]|uniref:hypothetical protein n=1 Tax=Bacillus sp. T33-2 TaxID=2054168 RepID=UPI000C7613DB|nr:hypothetical protein [Bacillus sp. T33-2]PLR93848.1 hypothetical protein CVD19_19195 [Bacillus sp. T33-2]